MQVLEQVVVLDDEVASLDDGTQRTQLELSRVICIDKTTLITVLDQRQRVMTMIRPDFSLPEELIAAASAYEMSADTEIFEAGTTQRPPAN